MIFVVVANLANYKGDVNMQRKGIVSGFVKLLVSDYLGDLKGGEEPSKYSFFGSL